MHIQDQLYIELKVRILKELQQVILAVAFGFLNMISLLPSFFCIVVMTEFVLGNFANGFIALVNCIDCVKRQKISCVDRILTALAVSRLALLWVLALHWYATVFNPALYRSEVKTIVLIVWTVTTHFSLWLATDLSILYLLKIANFSTRLFLHLKWKAKRVVLMILLGSLVFLVSHLALLSIDESMQVTEYEGNITWKTKLKDIVHFSYVTVLTFENFVSFTMSMVAFLLLIFSLWKHLKRMQLSGKGTQDLSTKVHVRAMQTVISFVLLFVAYFLAVVISVWSLNSFQGELAMLCGQALTFVYPTSHSFILIWGNKKLNQDFLSVFWQVRCWLKEWKSSMLQTNKRRIICV